MCVLGDRREREGESEHREEAGETGEKRESLPSSHVRFQ